MKAIWWISKLLVVIGAINWGLVGAFNFDLVSTIFGDGSVVTRIVFILVGIAGLMAIKLLVGGCDCSSESSTPSSRPSSEPMSSM